MLTHGTLFFELGGIHKDIYLQDVLDRQKLMAFAAYLQGYTKAAISYASFTESEVLSGVVSDGDINDVGYYAILKIRNQEDKQLLALPIPAPDFEIFEEEEDRGYRVKDDIGEAITAEYAKLSGLTLVFEDGWLCGGTKS